MIFEIIVITLLLVNTGFLYVLLCIASRDLQELRSKLYRAEQINFLSNRNKKQNKPS